MVVQIEDCDEDVAVSAGTKILRNSAKVQAERQPSLSSINLRSQFIAMGFSPAIVDEMIQKNGEHDSNALLESLLSQRGMVKSLYGEMDKAVSLVEMGFTNEEVSCAIEFFGQEARVEELADSILARRIAITIEQEATVEELADNDDDNRRFKKVKRMFRDYGGPSSSGAANTSWLSGGVRSGTNWSVKKEKGNEMGSGFGANINADVGKAPYFLYGNVSNINKDTWKAWSEHLFSVQPEFVDTQTFSALSRNEGYLHNLPRDGRPFVGPHSQMTIEGAVPFTIEDLMETQQLELALGYPSGHTDMLGLSSDERIAAMRFGFQTDTVGHLLSVLKDRYLLGLRVLSIYSGVGGIEVALHRLGIPLKCVVSVEESEVNRKILKQWWRKTKQAGQLRQLSSISKVKTNVLEDLVEEFQGFDLVVGGTYSSCRVGGTMVKSTMGRVACQFMELVRIVKSLRTLYGLR